MYNWVNVIIFKLQLDSENLKITIAQLCNELLVCNFNILHILTKYPKCNSCQFTSDLLNTENLK